MKQPRKGSVYLLEKINKNNQQGNLLLLHVSEDHKMCARAFCILFIIVCSSTFLCFVVNKEPPYAISSRRYNFLILRYICLNILKLKST